MRLLRGIAALALAAAVVPLASPAPAQTGLSQAGFEAYLPQLEAQARRAGVSPATIASVFPNLVFSARTVQLDRAQPGGRPGSNPNPPFAPYRARHVTPALIANGQRHYAANLSRLQEIGRRYGVTPVGARRHLGPRDELRRGHRQFRPSQLARQPRLRRPPPPALRRRVRRRPEDDRPRRSAQPPQGQLGRRHRLSRNSCPASGCASRVDGDGDGRADIWRSEPDALASIANYLSNAGWKPGVPWGVAVRVPPGLDRSRAAQHPARAALPAGPRPPQPLADDRRMAAARASSPRTGSGRATARWRR